jgi:hypothetical protein
MIEPAMIATSAMSGSAGTLVASGGGGFAAVVPASSSWATGVLAQAGPVRLVVADPSLAPAASSGWMSIAMWIGFAMGLVVLVIGAGVALVVWRSRLRRRTAGDPLLRARDVLCTQAGLSASDRRVLERLASELEPHASPAVLLLSPGAMKRAIGSMLERSSAPADLVAIERIVRRVWGAIDPGAADELHESARRRSAKPAVRRAAPAQRPATPRAARGDVIPAKPAEAS